MSKTTGSTGEQIAAVLNEPFPEEVTHEGEDGFTSVKFGHYVAKLLDTREAGAQRISIVQTSQPFVLEFGDYAALVQQVRVSVQSDDSSLTSEGAGAVALDRIESDRDLANAVKAAHGDAVKRACIGLGVNLDTYTNEEEEEKPKSGRSSSRGRSSKDDEDEKPSRRSTSRGSRSTSSRRSSSRSNENGSNDDWDGEDEITFGTFKGTKYKDIHGGWLNFVSEGKNPPDEVQYEIDRRGDDYDPEEKDPNYKPKGGRGGGRTNRNSGSRSGRGLSSGDRKRNYD